jgi:hypothetical protein
MKKISLLILLAISANVFSQITITQSDMPNSSDTIRYSVTNDINNYDTTGAGITWDYSSLTSNSQALYEFKTALAINPIYVIPFGLFGYGLKLSDGFGAGPISLSNIYNFYKKSSTKLTIEGYGAEVTGIPLPSTYSDPDEVYQFPLDYGDHDTSTFDVRITIPTIGNIRMYGDRINIVDGWGTLITPYGTFNTIRLKSVVNEIDSVNISLLPFPFGITRNTVTYKWLCNGEKIPALELQGTEIGGNFTPTQIRYRDNFNESAIPFTPVANFSADITNCSIHDTVSFINNSTPTFTGNTSVWTITPNTFVYVGGTNNTSDEPRVRFTANGLYTINLVSTVPPVSSAGAPVSDDTTRIDYILVRDYGTSIQTVTSVSEVKFYPNPVIDFIQISTTSTIKYVNILDEKGAIVSKNISLENNSINVKNLSKGIYFIETCDQNNKVVLSKFIKN